jgi:hypothetical protein
MDKGKGQGEKLVAVPSVLLANWEQRPLAHLTLAFLLLELASRVPFSNL